MALLDALEDEQLMIQFVAFNYDTIIVEFQEKRDIADDRIRTKRDEILMNTDIRQQMYLRLQEILRDLVDGTYDEAEDGY